MTAEKWLSPVDQRYLRQDFTDYRSHRLNDGSDRDAVLHLAKELNVPISETFLERGESSTRALLIGQSNTESDAAIIFLHGGGHMFGDAYSQADELVRWAAELHVQSISVDYRLSPEHPYPAALDDASTALGWLREHARHLGICASNIYLYGISAGGGIAAGLALRDAHAHTPLAGIILAAPMLDHRTSVGSDIPHHTADVYTWSHANNRQGWAAYLGELEARGSSVDRYASPGSTNTIPHLPNTYLDVGSADLFYEEALAFAGLLRTVGTPVTINTWENGYHGFETLAPDSIATATSRAARMAWLQQALGKVTPSEPPAVERKKT